MIKAAPGCHRFSCSYRGARLQVYKTTTFDLRALKLSGLGSVMLYTRRQSDVYHGDTADDARDADVAGTGG
jgi:hypothetical protein